MVKIAFICEGETEFIVVTSPTFKNFLQSNNLESVKEIDATGNGNLLPHNIVPFDKACKAAGAEKIIVLCDLENYPCFTDRKQSIDSGLTHIHVIAKRQIEAWFLADSEVMSSLLKHNFNETYPEAIEVPFHRIDSLYQKHTQRGIGSSKLKFAKRMVRHGFDVTKAANHPNCSSAKYFIDKESISF